MAWSGTPHAVLLSTRNFSAFPSAARKVVISVQISLRSALDFIAAWTASAFLCAFSLILAKALQSTDPGGRMGVACGQAPAPAPAGAPAEGHAAPAPGCCCAGGDGHGAAADPCAGAAAGQGAGAFCAVAPPVVASNPVSASVISIGAKAKCNV